MIDDHKLTLVEVLRRLVKLAKEGGDRNLAYVQKGHFIIMLVAGETRIKIDVEGWQHEQ